LNCDLVKENIVLKKTENRSNALNITNEQACLVEKY